MENKTGKYFKYAIGEIILVVIGILIALQINNWNNNKKDSDLEIKMLKEIFSNLNRDIKDIESQINLNNLFIKNNSNVLNHLIHKTTLTDSLKHSYSFLYGYGHFSPKTVGYENLRSNDISLIKNDLLRNDISELYENKYYEIGQNIRPSIKGIQEIHINEIISKINHQELYVKAEPMNLVLLQNDLKFQESLKWIIWIRKWTNERFKEGILEIKKVQEEIKEEIKIKE